MAENDALVEEKANAASEEFKAAIRSGSLRVSHRNHFDWTEEDILGGLDNTRWDSIGSVIEGNSLSGLVLGNDTSRLDRLVDLLSHPSDDYLPMSIFGGTSCYKCSKQLYWETNGRELRAYSVDYKHGVVVGQNQAGKPVLNFPRDHDDCAYHPAKPFEVEIDIPSGTMAISDNLFRWFGPSVWKRHETHYPDFHGENDIYDTELSANHWHGQRMVSRLYEKAGVARFVASQDIYRIVQHDGGIFIARPVARGDQDDDLPSLHMYRSSYWVADKARLEATVPSNDKGLEEPEGIVYADVAPGRYKVSHMHHMRCVKDIPKPSQITAEISRIASLSFQH